jgi:hypothetical protein
LNNFQAREKDRANYTCVAENVANRFERHKTGFYFVADAAAK